MTAWNRGKTKLETPLNWIRKNPWPAFAGVVALGFWWATRTPRAAESVPQAPESPEKA